MSTLNYHINNQSKSNQEVVSKMALSLDSPKIKGFCKGFPPIYNNKVSKIGKEKHHLRYNSCVERISGGGVVQPLAKGKPNSLALSRRNCRGVD